MVLPAEKKLWQALFCVERLGGFRVGGNWGCLCMPSAAYLRRQADICLRLAAIASDEAASSRLLAIHQDYTAKADAMEAGGEAPQDAMTPPGAAHAGKHGSGAGS
jgi:hypothetical protein